MSKNLFNSVQLTKPNKNVFDLTHDVKLTGKMGKLMPIMCIEAVPGDKFNIAAETMVRFAPLIAPVMHRFDVSIHYFFVPNRILWEGWEKWITGNNLAGDEPDPVAPYVPIDWVELQGSNPFLHYMGLPLASAGSGDGINVNALPFAAYQCIYNEYYRDQNNIIEVDYKLQDGPNTGAKKTALLTLRTRAWEHDYFTAALPFAQKANAVDIPLGDVQLKTNWSTVSDQYPVFRDGLLNPNTGTVSNVDDLGTGFANQINVGATGPSAYDPMGSLEVQSTTINDLRRAFRLQEWLEKNARGGTRYVENILMHFGVRSSDARLQRPEYIVGVKTPVVISEIVNTTGEVGGLPQGNMAGHGVAVVGGKFGGYFCEEHGFIIGILSVLPKPAYFQGLHKMFSKFDRLDYYWPSFANIGEQEVKNKELFLENVSDNRDDTFGYIPRYAEYKYQPNRVAGEFMTSLDFWHLARKFATQPQLNPAFIECNPDDRIFAVEGENADPLYIQVLNKVRAVRPMPKFGSPMM